MLLYSKEPGTAVFLKLGYFIEPFTQKSAAVPCFRKWTKFSVRHISHDSGDIM